MLQALTIRNDFIRAGVWVLGFCAFLVAELGTFYIVGMTLHDWRYQALYVPKFAESDALNVKSINDLCITFKQAAVQQNTSFDSWDKLCLDNAKEFEELRQHGRY